MALEEDSGLGKLPVSWVWVEFISVRCKGWKNPAGSETQHRTTHKRHPRKEFEWKLV